MSTATSFKRFSELPLEIQSEIWRYAATPAPAGILLPQAGTLNIVLRHHTMLEESFFVLISPYYMAYWRDVFHSSGYRLACRISQARKSLMGTCSLARRVALEMWRKDVESIQITLLPDKLRDREAALRDVKGQIIMLLDGLIG